MDNTCQATEATLFTALGQAEGLDTRRVALKVVHQLNLQINGWQPKAGILLAGSEFDHQLLLDQINRAFPGLSLVGCTTAGEFSTAWGTSDDSACLLLLGGSVAMASGLGTGVLAAPKKAARQAVQEALGKLDASPTLCLAFPDGDTKHPKRLVESLEKELGPDCPVFGGLAGNISLRLHNNFPFYQDRAVQDSCPVLILSGPLEIAFGVANSWKPIGAKSRVTRADGRRVYTIGDQTAMDFYRHYLGPHDDPAQDFPLAVFPEKSDLSYVRGLVRYHPEDGSVVFSENVPQGSMVQLTEARRDFLLSDVRKTGQALVPCCGNMTSAFGLAFSCSLRKSVLGTSAQEELKILRHALPPGSPLLGFFGFGEIAPLEAGAPSMYHSASLVALLVGICGMDQTPPGDDVPRIRAPEGKRGLSKGELSREQLLEQNRFLTKKLARAQRSRKFLEQSKDSNASLLRQILQEVEQGREKLAAQEAALRKSEEKYRRIVETAGEGFVLMDENMVIIDVNEAYCRLLGYNREDLLGKKSFEMANRPFRRFLEANREQLLSKNYRRFEGALMAQDGRQVPLLIHGSTLRDEQGKFMGHMAFLTDISEHKKALVLAGQVQQNLMPGHAPKIAGLDVAGRSVPCQEIGGDYFDFFEPMEEGEGLGIVVGDVTGHGVDAALVMTTARAFLRMRASMPGEISEVLSEMNRHLAQDVLEMGMFMTLFYLTVSPDLGTMQWVRAGHDPAILINAKTGNIAELSGPGLAMGVAPDFAYTQNILEFAGPDQIIALATDGIWETMDPKHRMYGKERFHRVLVENAGKKSEEIIEAVFSDLEQFSRGTPSQDDQTLVVVKTLART